MKTSSNNGWPKTVTEAIKIIWSELSDQEKARISRMDDEAWLSLHFTLGMQIRNRFGLWEGNSMLIEDCERVAGLKLNHIDEVMHPDDASTIILQALSMVSKAH